MSYRITEDCLKCGICITGCPSKAIVSDKTVKESDGLVLYSTRIDETNCTDCGVCVSEEYWCPAEAIVQMQP